MIFDKRLKPEMVVECPEGRRLEIQNVQLDVAGARLVATNGKCLLAVPVEIEEGDAPGPLPEAAFRESRKLGGRGKREARIECNGSAKIQTGASFPRPHFDVPEANRPQFPDWDACIPKPETQTMKLTLDAFMLADLVKAAGSENGFCTLHFAPGGKSGMRVQILKGPESLAVLMPISLG